MSRVTLNRTKNPYDIYVDKHKCRRCSYCIRVCPTKTIKAIKSGFEVIAERCIMCGGCIRMCPHGALTYHDGFSNVQDFLAAKTNIVAVLDPAFPVETELGTPRQVVSALKQIGFAEVWEGAFGADLISRVYFRLLHEETITPIISSFCPAIVFYIQKYYPQLIPNLAPVVSPMIAVGKVARELKGADWKVVYITSCFARMGEMVTPEVAGYIDEVITFDDIRRLVHEAGIDQATLPETEFEGPRPYRGRIIPVIGGLSSTMWESLDFLSDEISITGGNRQSISAIGQLAQGDIQGKFLDCVFCNGCVDGPFAKRNLSILASRQIVARYTKSEMDKQDFSGAMAELDRFQHIDLSRSFQSLEQKLPTPTEEEIGVVLRKIGKLPPHQNLDCRACGYSSCRDKAIAVVQGMAHEEYCLPYLLAESKRIYHELEKSHEDLKVSHQDLEQAQTQLIRAEKMASIGQLAAGVAHEINNPLSTILLYSHMFQKSLAPDDSRKEDIALVISETNRAKEIVQGLLSFAREKKLRVYEINVNDILEDVLNLIVNQSLFLNIEIKKFLAPDMQTIVADETQLKQVFLNIILNAAQAMGGNGTLTISTTFDSMQVKVKIADSGPGITPEVMANLFHPFFTTREKGTGLGLAISYGIVERHQGKIDVETELGKGTTFIITLPVTAIAETAGVK